uniref:tRNA wybutosine-synthesizing protein 2 homolog n=1 Tax=Macrostomum lignano TaxID=282301 RepID=A0A1I8IE03_9PLAT
SVQATCFAGAGVEDRRALGRFIDCLLTDAGATDSSISILREIRRRQSLLNQAELAHLAEFGVNLGDKLQADQLETRTVAVTYEHYSLSAVLDRLLPPNTQLSSFSVVGHIAHFNLKEEVLPYGQLIGQVVISKLPNIRTVVNKRSQINNEYRNFELELLAGEPNYVTLHKEYGLEFELDFSKVYWNSRLSTEHHRVVEKLRPGDLVFDLCAGVGPFAVPALKLGATVFANDLNPTAHSYLEANLRRNLRKSQLISQPELVKAFNMDAREFVAGVLAPRYAEAVASGFEQQVVAIANLPGMAVDLLDCFVGCVKE